MRAVADDLGDIWSKKNEVVQLIDIIKALNEKKNYPKAIEIFQLVQTEFHKYQQHNESCSIQ